MPVLNFIIVESHSITQHVFSIWPILFKLCLQDSLVTFFILNFCVRFIYVVAFLFSLIYSISLYKYTMIYFAIILFKEIYVFSIFKLILLIKCYYEHCCMWILVHILISCICRSGTEVELVVHRICICLDLADASSLFKSANAKFHFRLGYRSWEKHCSHLNTKSNKIKSKILIFLDTISNLRPQRETRYVYQLICIRA